MNQINDYLANKVKYDHKVGITGFADADIQLANLKSEIGRSEPASRVDRDASVKLDSLIGKAEAQINLTLTARPILTPKPAQFTKN